MIDLVVDGEVHALCASGDTCRAVNNLALGPREVFLRFVPRNSTYSSASTSPVTYNNGPTLPPPVGFLIDGGRFSTSQLSATINVAYGDSGQDVIGIRLSNINTTDANGDLTGATEVVLGSTPNWGLTATWALASGADGARTVYAQLKRLDGSWSPVFSDGILLDTQAPAGSIVINGGAATIGDAWGASVPEQELTGSVSDGSLGADGSIVHVAISNDGVRYVDAPFQGDPADLHLSWQVLYDPYGPTDTEPGTKTVYVKFQDEAGNWSPAATDTIRYVSDYEVGSLLVNGGPAQTAPDPMYLSDPTPSLTITLNQLPPEGVKSVRVYGHDQDGSFKAIAWSSTQTTATVAWSLTDSTYGYRAGDGLKDLRVLITTNSGRMRDLGALMILDRSIPLSPVPVPAFAIGSVVGPSSTATAQTLTGTISAATELQWTDTSGASISKFTLQRQHDGSWGTVTLPTPTSTLSVQPITPNSTNQYRVRGTTTTGTDGAWQTTSPYSMTVIQEGDQRIKYSGTWRKDSTSTALGGGLRSAGAKGASAKITVTGRAFAWVAPRSTGSNASVYVDGQLVKTVILAGTNDPRRVVFSVAWTTVGQHTIKIVKKTTANRLPIDAFLVLA